MASIAKLVEEATDDFLVGSDWERNFLIFERITSTAGAEEFVGVVKRNLDGGSERTIARTLELLQAGMQNNYLIVRGIHHPSFQQFLVEKARNARWPHDQKDKFLNLIRAWAEAYHPGHQHPGDQFPNFFKAYQFLRNSSPFPGKNDDSNFTPPLPQSQPSTVRHSPSQSRSFVSPCVREATFILQDHSLRDLLGKLLLPCRRIRAIYHSSRTSWVLLTSSQRTHNHTSW